MQYDAPSIVFVDVGASYWYLFHAIMLIQPTPVLRQGGARASDMEQSENPALA
jgi:hypothetical protein